VTRAKRLFAAITALCVLGSAAVLLTRRETPVSLYAEMTAAAQQMEQCLSAIAAEKETRAIAIDPEDDPLHTGVIGSEYSPVTTTLGSLPAKRTSATLSMAALCVVLLDEMGVQAGDSVGACFSGSFPGLCVALLCACDALGVDVRYTASVGSSSYGGNQTQLCTPEMLWLLYRQGLISAPPFAVTPGGDNDRLENTGAAVFADEQAEAMIGRIRAAGMNYTVPETYTQSLSLREDGYGDIGAFISIGGHIAAMGLDGYGYELGYGVLQQDSAALTGDSGLLARYLARGTPALSLINIEALCGRYGLQFDPAAQSVPGEGGLYYRSEYLKPLLYPLLLAAAALLLLLWRETHTKQDHAMRGIRPLLDACCGEADKERRLSLVYSAWRIARQNGGPALEDILGQAQAARLRAAAETVRRRDADGSAAPAGIPDAIPDEVLDLLARYLRAGHIR